MFHLERLSAILLALPMICVVLKHMSAWAFSMNMFLVIAANVISLVLPELRTDTTAALSQKILTAFPCH